jgi:hypothetical protein
MTFIPDQPTQQQAVPYFEDVTSAGGWVGHTTQKSIDKLITEISTALVRLGGSVTNVQSGNFQDDINPRRKRPGYIIRYNYATPDGRIIAGKIDVCGLPLRSPTPQKEIQSRKMALYMLRDSLEGLWYMQQLSPGLVALMPFMLAEGDVTFSQKFILGLTLPAPVEDEYVDGEVDEVKP